MSGRSARATNADVLIAAISQHPGATDGDLRIITGIESHQQVNQVCRRLEQQGRVDRRTRDDGRIGNFPLGTTDPAAGEDPAIVAPRRSSKVADTATGTAVAGPITLPPPGSALIILPCSKAKKPGGRPGHAGSPAITDQLPPELRTRLTNARSHVELRAGVDTTALLPASERYQGHLYEAAGPAITTAVEGGYDLVILSGGFGLLHPLEPISNYDRAFRRFDWPSGLLEDALIELAQRHGHDHVVAFCSQTTGYAQLIRHVPWKANGLAAHLVTPEAGGRGGAQRLVPQATGEALAAYLGGALIGGWISSDGIGLNVEELT